MIKIALFIACLFTSQLLLAQKQPKRQTITIKTPTTCNHCKICETCGGKLEGELVCRRSESRSERIQATGCLLQRGGVASFPSFFPTADFFPLTDTEEHRCAVSYVMIKQ